MNAPSDEFMREAERLVEEIRFSAEPREIIIARSLQSTAEKARAAAEKEIARLKRQSTDRAYMLDAYRNMLGEKGMEVAKMWAETGVQRIHFDWQPDAWKMSGEERASFILGIATLPGTVIDNIDTPAAIMAQKETGQ